MAGSEPTLHELLEEPIVRLLMASDGVSRRDIVALRTDDDGDARAGECAADGDERRLDLCAC
jgi:hypothetical protein